MKDSAWSLGRSKKQMGLQFDSHKPGLFDGQAEELRLDIYLPLEGY